MSGVPIAWYLALAATLFAIGVFGALTRRNAITVFLAIELMLNSVNLVLIAYARQLAETLGPADGPAAAATGQVIVLFVIAVAAAEAAVGLALFIAVYRRRRTIDIDRLNLMRW
jgi:NADH-quinone oxidoreductase subunit K